MTSVIVTHEMRFAKNIASKVVFLADKGIYEVGTPEEIFDHPSKPLTREFMFRNHMVETDLEKDVTDIASVMTKLKNFIQRYEYTAKQLNLFDVVLDELIYPVWNVHPQAKDVRIRLVCSESSMKHMLFVCFKDIDEDPLNENCIDDISLKILEARFSNIVSKKNDEGGWEICMVM